MRIACLQFAPQVGDIDNNLNRADAVLSKANPKNIDLLVLPELAFSGYNFRSLQHITPYLEPTAAGITSLWARTTALKYDCHVTVGYPEKVDVSPKWPTSPEYYNSAITVNAEGETIANYRKSFLYYTDETWALEGPDGFFGGHVEGLGNVAMGICKWPTKSFERMDLNPYKFEAPWSAWEFAYHILHKQANLVILSMAWLTRESASSFSIAPKEPDMDTLSYWLARLEPVIRAEGDGEIIVVLANRTGTEGEATYAGTSAVLGIQNGEVKVYGILGRGEKELLVVDTNKRPRAKLVSEPNSAASLPSPTTIHPKLKARSMASNRSVDTELTAPSTTSSTSPASYGTAEPIDDLLSPLSPEDPIRPHLDFNPNRNHPETDSLRESLMSSIGGRDVVSAPLPDSPILNRPESTKSRNASQNRDRRQTPVNHVEDEIWRGRSREQITSVSPYHPDTPGSEMILHHPEALGQPQVQQPPPPKSPHVVDASDEAPVLATLDATEQVQHIDPVEQQATNLPPLADTRAQEAAAIAVHEAPEELQVQWPLRVEQPNLDELTHTPALDVPAELSDTEPNDLEVLGSSSLIGSIDQGLATSLHDDREELRMSQLNSLKSPSPQSASQMPEHYQTSFTTKSFGPRSEHTSSRPRSAVW